jgi:transcriptional regulator GlxA family with amidase domain
MALLGGNRGRCVLAVASVTAHTEVMQIALVLYPKFTALDIIGPFQCLADVPGHDVVFVAEQVGLVIDHTGRCPLTATATFAEVTAPDVVVVPGGMSEDYHGAVHPWLKSVYPTTTWMTSVCTGSIFLAAAGLLDGLDATTHWQRTKQLESFGARYTEERVVERGNIITAAGVSSGIDMALTLLDRMHGPLIAQAVQLSIEYDPQPPFNAGSPSKAPAEVVDLVKAFSP